MNTNTPVQETGNISEVTKPNLHYDLPIVNDYAELATKAMHRPLPRRALLGVLGAAAAYGFVEKVQQPIMDRVYGDRQTYIELPSWVDPPPKPTRRGGVTSSGMNGDHGRLMVDTMAEQKIYERSFLNGYYQFGTEFGVTPLQRCTQEFFGQHGIKIADINGLSEGLLIGIAGVRHSDTAVRLLVGNDSPYDIDDAKHRRFAKVMAKLSEIGLYRGDIIGETAAFYYDYVEQHGWNSLVSSAENAFHTVITGKDPRFVDGQLIFLDQADMNKHIEGDRIMVNGGRMMYLMTEQPSTDPIVYDTQAAEKWDHWCKYKMRIPFEVVLVPQDGHAHAAAGYEAASARMRKIVQEGY